MAKQKEQGTKFWVCVDEYVDDPETGALKLVKERMHRPVIMAVNKREYTKDGVYFPPVVRSMVPDQWHGLYELRGDDEYFQQIDAVMKKAADDSFGKIIGPFESREDAIQAKAAARKLTPREQAATMTAKANELAEENKALSSEVARLQAQLAAIQRKDG